MALSKARHVSTFSLLPCVKLLAVCVQSYAFSLFLGPLLCLCAISIASANGFSFKMANVTGLTVWMMTWFLNGAVRMGITGLLPLVCFPLMGVCSAKSVSEMYFTDGVVICWASLLMAHSFERHSLDKRFARFMLRRTTAWGHSGVLLGFVFCTGILSMWLSNTATAALMCPLSQALFKEQLRQLSMNVLFTEEDKTKEKKLLHASAKACDLAIAYASTLGGMSTLTGTGANLVLSGTLTTIFGPDNSVSYLNWIFISLPLSIIHLLILWMILLCCVANDADDGNIFCVRPWNCFRKYNHRTDVEMQMHTEGNSELHLNPRDQVLTTSYGVSHVDDRSTSDSLTTDNPLTLSQIIVLSTFALTMILWMTRDPPGGNGWARLFENPNYISDGTGSSPEQVQQFFAF